jgi:hypothetical protein
MTRAQYEQLVNEWYGDAVRDSAITRAGTAVTSALDHALQVLVDRLVAAEGAADAPAKE